LLVFKVYRDLF